MSVAPIRPETAPESDRFERWPDGSLKGMFTSKPPEIEWFAHERLAASRPHALVGVGGSSKTAFLYQCGMGAPLGRLPWSWEVRQVGSSALFLTEDVTADVWRTMHRLGEHLTEEERDKVARHMRVFPLAGKDARMLTLIEGGRLVENDVLDWVMERIDRLPKPVAYLGFDPALALTEGDELNQAHQRRLGELMYRIAIESGACVVLTAHASKGLMQAEELGSHAARGGGALTDAVRGEFVMRNMTADEARRFGIEGIVERRTYVQLAATKGNHLPPDAYAPIWLKRGAGGTLSQVSLEQVERGSVADRELRALDILARAASQGDVTMSFWKGQCAAAGLIQADASPRAQDKAIQRIRDALRDAGLVKASDHVRGAWVPA